MNVFDDAISIRSIQHYLYCPRRWGLIELECAWAENVFVAKGKLLHERVDSGKMTRSFDTVSCRNVSVYHDEWNLLGVIDCVELKRSSKGVYFAKFQDTFQPCIVEYKPTAPKDGTPYRKEDAMQLLAQKICLESVLHTEVATCFYYANTKKRVKAEFSDADYLFLKETLDEMKSLRQKGIIPKKRKDQKCSGCSMADICMPKGYV